VRHYFLTPYRENFENQLTRLRRVDQILGMESEKLWPRHVFAESYRDPGDIFKADSSSSPLRLLLSFVLENSVAFLEQRLFFAIAIAIVAGEKQQAPNFRFTVMQIVFASRKEK
jgi:hypothetical protein